MASHLTSPNHSARSDDELSMPEDISISDGDMVYSVESLDISLSDDGNDDSDTVAVETPEGSDDEATSMLDEHESHIEESNLDEADVVATTASFADDEQTTSDGDEATAVDGETLSDSDTKTSVLNELRQWAQAHPVQAAALGISTVALASPMTLAAPVLGLAGFGSSGVAGASLAAFWQSTIGNVAGGSLFALLQSAGAGGVVGTTAVGTTVSMGGMAGVASVIGGIFGRNRNRTGSDEGGSAETPGGGGNDGGSGGGDRGDQEKRQQLVERWRDASNKQPGGVNKEHPGSRGDIVSSDAPVPSEPSHVAEKAPFA